MSFIKLEDDTKIYYKIMGTGPILVLNHGYGSSHKSLQYVADFLKDHFQCFLWDQKGHGESDKFILENYDQTKKLYTLERIADELYEILSKLNLIDNSGKKKVYMYGHSMGGMISQIFALKYGSSLKALALGSTTAKSSDEERKTMLISVKKGRIALDEDFFNFDAPNGFNPEFIKEHPKFIKEKVSDKLKVPKDVTISLLDNFINDFNTTYALSHLLVPTLILHGKLDSVIKFEEGLNLSKIIPNSKFIGIDSQNHEINKEIPEQIANFIQDFFLSFEEILDFDGFIKKLDSVILELVEIFNLIGKVDFDVNENNYFRKVGNFSKLLREMLGFYFECPRDVQLKYKPQILYYRQVQGYLVFLLRYPEILSVKEHDEIQQTLKFLENKEYLIEKIYNDLANQQTQLFEGNFRDELENKLKEITKYMDKIKKK